MPKPTNKERDQQIAWLTRELSNFVRMFAGYVEYKGDSADFQKYLIDVNEKIKQKAKENDTSSASKVDS